MIVSHKHKFIFFKTRKTAGTSVELMLSPYCGDQDIIPPLGEEDVLRPTTEKGKPRNYHIPRRFYSKTEWLKKVVTGRTPAYVEHHPAAKLITRLDPEVWETYFKFAFDRNPFDKVVSFYYYRRGDQTHSSFRDWLLDDGTKWLSSYDTYSIHNRVVLDKIYRYEQMDASLADLSVRLGLANLRLPAYRAKGNFRKERGYRHLIDEESRRLLSVMYAREIALLGYEF